MDKKPLIFDYIEKKIEDENIPYKYSEAHDLNVFSVNGNTVPFVQFAKESVANSNFLDLKNKTFTEREAEEDKGMSCSMEFLTKTKQDREDEDHKGIACLLELMTKTEQAREDDESRDTFMSMQNLYELYTKTRQERESENEATSIFECNNELFDLL